MTDDEVLVFDTGPLSHFARQSWLGVLKAVVGDRTAIIPDVVVDELTAGSQTDSRLQTVLDADWIERRELRSDAELLAFSNFSALLVKGMRNRGEAGVLALASILDCIAVIDDGAGRKAAEDHGIKVRPTLALLCEAIRGSLLTVSLVSALADDLLDTEYRLPFGPGGFERWAREHGQLE
jgi:predicted nucleic acid-binding protein